MYTYIYIYIYMDAMGFPWGTHLIVFKRILMHNLQGYSFHYFSKHLTSRYFASAQLTSPHLTSAQVSTLKHTTPSHLASRKHASTMLAFVFTARRPSLVTSRQLSFYMLTSSYLKLTDIMPLHLPFHCRISI